MNFIAKIDKLSNAEDNKNLKERLQSFLFMITSTIELLENQIKKESNNSNSLMRKFSNDGIIYVPKALTVNISNPHLYVSNGNLYIGDINNKNETIFVPLKIDAKGNVRIPYKTLDSINKTAKCFNNLTLKSKLVFSPKTINTIEISLL